MQDYSIEVTADEKHLVQNVQMWKQRWGEGVMGIASSRYDAKSAHTGM